MGFKKRADLVGVKTGMLTVIEFSHVNGHAYWKCKCECGNEIILPTNRIVGKRTTQSCGCLQKKDLTGQRFNRLIVIGLADKKKK